MSKRIGYDANGNKVHIEDTRYICTCKECLPLPDELIIKIQSIFGDVPRTYGHMKINPMKCEHRNYKYYDYDPFGAFFCNDCGITMTDEVNVREIFDGLHTEIDYLRKRKEEQ